MVIEIHFLHDESEESIIKQWEELCNVESESTCWYVLDPTCSDDMSECNIYICCWFEFKTTELARMDEGYLLP